jgi:leucyl aminopeptidase (aminopeptidase T)
VNGAPGIFSWLPGGQLFSVMRFTVRNGRIVEIDVRRNNDLNQRDIRVRED